MTKKERIKKWLIVIVFMLFLWVIIDKLIIEISLVQFVAIQLISGFIELIYKHQLKKLNLPIDD